MKPDVKICGLSTPETLEAALARGASHVGFVHFAKSPRHLDIEPMAKLVRLVGGRAETVIVTVDPDDALVARFADEVKPDWLQLHGRETPVAEAADLKAVAAYRSVADRILLDSKRPKGSNLPGGNGVSFDWRLLAALDPNLAYMLSGGIDAGNVAEALRVARPSGIDVSSGVESAPGIKDVGRIATFFDELDRIASEKGPKP